jgi:hypothetical protein
LKLHPILIEMWKQFKYCIFFLFFEIKHIVVHFEIHHIIWVFMHGTAKRGLRVECVIISLFYLFSTVYFYISIQVSDVILVIISEVKFLNGTARFVVGSIYCGLIHSIDNSFIWFQWDKRSTCDELYLAWNFYSQIKF